MGFSQSCISGLSSSNISKEGYLEKKKSIQATSPGKAALHLWNRTVSEWSTWAQSISMANMRMALKFITFASRSQCLGWCSYPWWLLDGKCHDLGNILFMCLMNWVLSPVLSFVQHTIKYWLSPVKGWGRKHCSKDCSVCLYHLIHHFMHLSQTLFFLFFYYYY